MILSLSNFLSLIRFPLALFFLQSDPTIRLFAIILAMISDSIDGYFARKNDAVSKLGIILDPAMDKFFVYFCLTILFIEGKIELWEALAMISRDFFLCLYGAFMMATGKWKTVVFRAIRWGKVTTALQFFTLIAIVLNISLPSVFFGAFILMGWLAFLELFQDESSSVSIL